MNKFIGRLQFIPSQNSNISIEQQVKEYCAGGGNWVQLELHNLSNSEMLTIAKKCKFICIQADATLIIRKHVEIAQKVDADGVHLNSLSDFIHVRSLLGENKIIGGTATSLDNIKKLVDASADYIELTLDTTMDTHHPLDYSHKNLHKIKRDNIKTPIIGRSSVTITDITGLFETGIYGITLCSLVSKSKNIGLTTVNTLAEIGKAQSANFFNMH